MSDLLNGHGYEYRVLCCCVAQGYRAYLSLGDGVGTDAIPSGRITVALINLSNNRHTGVMK